MGIDKHGLLAIEYAEKTGADFSRVCTLGRQEILVTKAFYEKILRKTENFDRIKQLQNIHGEIYHEFYENLFKVLFKSKVTDSIDANNFEDASIVHDMNFKLPPSKTLKSKYTLIIDFGCLEHIFNIAVSFENVVNLCQKGGTILHVLPSNQYAGHGFYQFSPEFFFSLYSTERGFNKTEVFIAEKSRPYLWFKCSNPIEIGRRCCFDSKDQAYVIVKTTRVEENEMMLLKNPIQQSDWLKAWEQGKNWRNRQEKQNTTNITLKNKLITMIKKIIKKVIPQLDPKHPQFNIYEQYLHLFKEFARRKINNPAYLSNNRDLKRSNILEILKANQKN